MHFLNRPAGVGTLPAWAALTLSLSACAAGPSQPPPQHSAPTLTHNCQPQETVGFSCELHDHRLLSMCASPGFAIFKGLPKDNPGYAYLVVGTPEGKVQYSYPPNPYDYKQHFFKDVPTNGIPYLFITSEKGRFFYMSEEGDNDSLGAGQWRPENLPEGWSVSEKDKPRACARLLEFGNFHAMGVTHGSVWRQKEWERREAEEPKMEQP